MTAEISETSPGMALGYQPQLARVADRWTPHEGIHESAIQGLDLLRCEHPTNPAPFVYEPSLCFLVQGTKAIELGDRQIAYRPLSYLMTAVHLPVLGRIVEATPERPYLALRLKVDRQEVAEMMMGLGESVPFQNQDDVCSGTECGLCVTVMDEPMQNAVLRLLQLLDSPNDIPVLAPLVRREIIYRALMGERGSIMRKFAATDTQAHRISTVISTLREHYAQPLRVSQLAEAANMSESTLYHSFKQVTRMSPLQFQKKLRLHEARRLMLTEGLEAATASYRVGYESPSHFSREYSRLFGAPPKADIALLQGARETADSA